MGEPLQFGRGVSEDPVADVQFLELRKQVQTRRPRWELRRTVTSDVTAKAWELLEVDSSLGNDIVVTLPTVALATAVEIQIAHITLGGSCTIQPQIGTLIHGYTALVVVPDASYHLTSTSTGWRIV